jgi:5'-AMP-activated protein kinase regulatory gamma subunit
MLESRARRIPIVDSDDETHRTMVVSVITQYRILKFIAVNVKETQKLRKPLYEMPNVGTYADLATASMDTPVMDVIHMLVKKNISSVPILDRKGVVLNVFEAVDVIALIKGGVYDDLNLTVGDALLKRSDVRANFFSNSSWALTCHRTSRVSSPARCQITCQPSTTQSAGHESIASS